MFGDVDLCKNMSKIFTNFYAINLLSFYVTEVLPIPTPKGIKIPTLQYEDCVIRSQLIFTNFDVYYSELENVIIFFAEGVNSFAKEATSKNLKTEHLQFHSRIYDDYKI